MSYLAEIDIAPPHRPDSEQHNRWTPLVNLYRPRAGGFLLVAAYLLVVYILYLGWHNRLAQPLTAESGAGYALGIVGGIMMLALLLYPMRKSLHVMRNFGSVKFWFQAHMLLGVVGPVCILFHSGFQLGSTNSNIALFCMLVVASSGLVGRYFYARIHHGLYGRKATLDELSRHAALLGESLRTTLASYPEAARRIQTFEQTSRSSGGGFLASLAGAIYLGIRTWALYYSIRLSMPVELSGRERRAVLRHIGARLESIRKIAEFRFYDRLFAIWHVLHFPLFVMMLVTGIVHVIAVHMY
jgi:hypothetical protein